VSTNAIVYGFDRKLFGGLLFRLFIKFAPIYRFVLLSLLPEPIKAQERKDQQRHKRPTQNRDKKPFRHSPTGQDLKLVRKKTEKSPQEPTFSTDDRWPLHRLRL